MVRRRSNGDCDIHFISIKIYILNMTLVNLAKMSVMWTTTLIILMLDIHLCRVEFSPVVFSCDGKPDFERTPKQCVGGDDMTQNSLVMRGKSEKEYG